MKMDKKIGLRVDDTTLKILDGASQLYQSSMSELIRMAVAKSFALQVAEYQLNQNK